MNTEGKSDNSRMSPNSQTNFCNKHFENANEFAFFRQQQQKTENRGNIKHNKNKNKKKKVYAITNSN